MVMLMKIKEDTKFPEGGIISDCKKKRSILRMASDFSSATFHSRGQKTTEEYVQNCPLQW